MPQVNFLQERDTIQALALHYFQLHAYTAIDNEKFGGKPYFKVFVDFDFD